MPIWNPRNETMPRRELEQLQLERLQITANRAWDGVAHYRRQFEQIGLMPEHVRSLDDLRVLPFTTKEDLSRGYPYDMLAVPLREVVRIHAPSDPSVTRPVVSAYTKNDLLHWRELAARVLSAGGMTRDDVVQVSFTYGLLTDAFGLHQGAEEIGASVVPVSGGALEQQIAIMQDFRTTALACTPTHARQIAECLEERGTARGALSLRWGMLGGEPWAEAMREEIEGRLRISATDNYRVSEVMGPGVAGECEEQKAGLHINEDHFLCEIVDPVSGEALPHGQTGELVITTLTKEALPLLRYRTRDLTSLDPEPCACGRTLARMTRVLSRTDDLVIVGGVKLFPAQIEAALAQVEGAGANYKVFVDRVGATDRLEVQVEVSSALLTGDVRHLMRTQDQIRQRIEETVGLTAEVKLVEARSLGAAGQSASGGPRIVDRRAGEGPSRDRG